MRVLVTGASGHLGSALVPELLAAGHQVTGLARSDASAAALTARGVEVLRGSLADLDLLGTVASSTDAVVHLAFDHESMLSGDMAGAAALDRQVIETFADALAGSGKALTVASGTIMLAMLGLGRPALETDTLVRDDNLPRSETENFVIALAERGIRSSAVRIPPVVHSEFDRHGFAHMLIATARRTGLAGYLGTGANQWPAAHTLDVGALFARAAESAPAGTRLHAVGDEGLAMRDIAEVIGRRLNLPVQSVPAESAAEHFGFLAAIVGLDNPTSNDLTRELLAWKPVHRGLLEDLEHGHYFDAL
ncbi:SDR family oxidoreductase [Nocardia sp. NPDC020380]|uniref:SDR family oxidoreductase n=1 Tax=Nocardia sp. NPDC020380 TaxID=3364309 RepID=UPI00379DFF31